MAYQGLAQVEFGHIAAEEEAVALQKYFVETKEYSEILDTGKLLVIGRKGSGKSAIYVAVRDMELILQQEMDEELSQFAELNQLIERHFNEIELKIFTRQLGILYEDLPGQGKANKVNELIRYMERRGRIWDIVLLCEEERPMVQWGDLAERELARIERQQLVWEYDLVRLYQEITENFSISDLKKLCFTMGINYENLPGGDLGETSRELVQYCDRHVLVPDLVEKIKEERPQIDTEQFYKILPQSDETQIDRSISSIPDRKREAVIEALTLHDYPWEIHKQIKDAGVPLEQSYVNSWKYVIWVLLTKKFLSYDEPAQHRWVDTSHWKKLLDPNIRFLYRYLKQNYGSVAPSFTEILANKARNIRSLKVQEFGVETDTAEGKSQQLSRTINMVNHALESRLLTVLPEDKEYYLLFDQLDLGWDETEETKQLLIGLIMAARDVVRKARNAGIKLKIVIFLRSDIYESLRFEDKNKIWLGDTVKLIWDEQRLKELINKRIKTSSDGVWENVFSGESIQGMSQLSYIVEHTMLRPRDIIQFCSCTREVALKADKKKIDNDCILEGAKAYSDYMRREIQDECRASFPDIDKLLTVLKELGSSKFTQQQFLQSCKLKNVQNEKIVLQKLINLSVLGICRHAQIDYRYEVDHWDILEPTKELVIHPSLCSIFGIEQTQD